MADGFWVLFEHCLGLNPSMPLVWMIDLELVVMGLLNPNFILLAPQETSFWARENLSAWMYGKYEILPLLGYLFSQEAFEIEWRSPFCCVKGFAWFFNGALGFRCVHFPTGFAIIDEESPMFFWADGGPFGNPTTLLHISLSYKLVKFAPMAHDWEAFRAANLFVVPTAFLWTLYKLNPLYHIPLFLPCLRGCFAGFAEMFLLNAMTSAIRTFTLDPMQFFIIFNFILLKLDPFHF